MSGGGLWHGDVTVPYNEETNGKPKRTAHLVIGGYTEWDTGAYVETRFDAYWTDGEQEELTNDELDEQLVGLTHRGAIQSPTTVYEYLSEQIAYTGSWEPDVYEPIVDLD